MKWLTQLFSRRRRYNDLSVSIKEHLEEKIEELMEEGMSREEATHAARRDFGNVALLEERSREEWQWQTLESILADLKYAVRQLLKHPGFAVTAILTLALGIGANTAIFSVVDAILLRPLPIHDPGRVVVLHDDLPKLNLPRAGVSPPQFRDYSAHTNIFKSTALLIKKNLTLTGVGQSRRLLGMRASATLWPLLQIRPILGRTFTSAEDTYGNGHVVLLSEGLWQGVFGGAGNAVGQHMQLDDESYEVIGILPKSLQVLYPGVQLWVPIALQPQAFTEDERWTITYTMLARLRPGVTLEQARSVMALDAAHAIASVPSEHAGVLNDFGIEVRALSSEQVGDARQALYLLLATVVLVLLIACANVANLLLARNSARSREMALRTAVGAGRRHIIRQLLTESILLALLGGALGFLLGWWGIAVLVHLAPASLPHASTIRLNPTVFGFTFTVSMLAGILFGIAPAIQVSKVNLTYLKEKVPSGSSSLGHHRLRCALIVSEVALTFILLVGSGLLLRSFAKLLNVNSGFDATDVLTMRLSPSKSVNAMQSAAFSRTLLEHVSAIPGVRHVALAGEPPLMGTGNSIFVVRDYHAGPNGPQPHADVVMTSPDYFRAMGIPLLHGRAYKEEDIQAGSSVVMVDEALARRFWAGRDAVGKQLRRYNNGPWSTIIGVVGTVRSHTLATESKGTIYFPSYFSGMSLVVRSTSDPMQLAGAIRKDVQTLDPSQAVYNIMTMKERVAESVKQQRFATTMLTVFAALALVLAAVGLYGVMSFIVTQRVHEIGVRLALGAQHYNILQLIMGQGMRMALLGVLVGIAASLGLTKLISTLIFGITTTDPITFIGVAILLVLIAFAACYNPARRAMHVDPMDTLRYE